MGVMYMEVQGSTIQCGFLEVHGEIFNVLSNSDS